MNNCAYCGKPLNQLNYSMPPKHIYSDDKGNWFDSIHCKNTYEKELNILKGAAKFLTDVLPFGGW